MNSQQWVFAFLTDAKKAAVAACLANIQNVAAEGRPFTVDDVPVPAEAEGFDGRLMGIAMRLAGQRGVAQPTQTFVPSRKTSCHACPRRVWVRRAA